MNLSVVLPTHNRPAVLKKTLESLGSQTLRDFEVIVVNDGGETPEIGEYPFAVHLIEQENAGPATARNTGAFEAQSDIVLFIGDDCIADRNLLFRHFYNHTRDRQPKAVQGYTIWHPDLASEFQIYLHESGAQALWQNLKTDSGAWKHAANGFCLTTNFSISKRLFINQGGFNTAFKSAAWEDVELGYRLNRDNAPTFFDPGAINYHYHPYTLDDWIKRQQNEGYWRLTLCKIHPEFASGLISPEGLREAEKHNLSEVLHWAKQLDYIPGVEQERQNRWAQVSQLASAIGVSKKIDNEHPVAETLRHIHTQEQVFLVVSAIAALERNEISYAAHCYNWLLDTSSDNWAIWALAGEIMIEEGNRDLAESAFRQSLSIAPSDWAKRRLAHEDSALRRR